MAILTAIAVGSSVLSAFSSLRAAKKKKKRAKLIAKNKIEQADELQRRTDLELDLIEDTLNATVGRGRAQFAGNNIDVGSGASVQAEMASFENFTRTVLNKQRESTFRQDQLRLESKLGVQSANDAAKAANLQTGFNLVQSGINIFGGG